MRLVLPWLAAAALAGPATAQVVTLDEGSFTLFVNGSRVGHEQFTIQRQQGRGSVTILAYANISIDDRRLVPSLTADTTGMPVKYKLEESAVDAVVHRVEAISTGTLFTLTAMTPRGRSERDLRLARGSVVLDDDVVHQYYFVGRRDPGPLRALAPRRLAYEQLAVVYVDGRDVEIGNGTLPSRHLTVTSADGVVTDLWVDAAGRVLRVATPSRGFVAIRDEPPR
jgi:hypothetical protein